MRVCVCLSVCVCVVKGVCGGVEFVDVVMCHSVVVEACLHASQGH